MENDFISGTEPESEISDGEPVGFFSDGDITPTPVPEETQSWLSIEDYGRLAVSSIPIGFLSGAIIMIVGYVILGIVKILKSTS